MKNQKAKVVIYTKDPCPYCVRAIRFFEEYGIQYEEVDLTDKPEEIDRIKSETGWRTVPIIMVNGVLIGGYNDMKALHEEGKLETLLQA
ncbi:MAG TPA: glutaredoxin [Pseudobdellovibrionaceae bacterium]|jgi:glutaredoxin 3